MTAAPTVLLAEDDTAIRTVVSRALSRQGYRVLATSLAGAMWNWVADGQGDVVITDVGLPDENSLDLLPRIRLLRPDLPIIVMSAQNTLLTAVRATERGAFEYLPKPFDIENLLATVTRSLRQRKRNASGDAKSVIATEEQLPIIGRAPAMQEIYRIIARLTGTDLTVLVTGESGTGKELVANALHEFGKRRDGPFVAVNMAAIPRELIESELFGHERGAFTGATSKREGRFEQANGGTLFLDEIGDMPLDAQTRLLRVLQQAEFIPVGGHQPIQTNLRIVAASHRDLRNMVAAGAFREDLYYRLNVVPIRLPSLRERLSDVPALAQHFLTKAQSEGLPAKTISHDGMRTLEQYDWPGNVRELENLVRRLVVLYPEDVIDGPAIQQELNQVLEGPPGAEKSPQNLSLSASIEGHVDEYFSGYRNELPPAGVYARFLREFERPIILRTLVATNGNQLKAADILGLNRNTLRKKIKELDIQFMRNG